MSTSAHRVTRTDPSFEPSERSSDVWETAGGPRSIEHDLRETARMAAELAADVEELCVALAEAPALDDVGSAVEDVRESTRRLEGLLHQAASGVRRRPAVGGGARPSLRVERVIQCVVRRARYASSMRGVRIEVVEAEDVSAAIERDVLERVLENLLDNALRFSSPGDVIEVATMRRNGRTLLAVADRGPGVPPHARDEIFASYRSGHPSGSGSHHGLGLAFCREVARAHGGDAWMFNRRNGGACFVFELR